MTSKSLSRNARLRAVQLQSGIDRLIYFVDHNQRDKIESVLADLPGGSLILLRAYDCSERADLAMWLRRRAKKGRFIFLVAADQRLARQVRADGVHSPEWQLFRPPTMLAIGFRTVACHNARAVRRAQALGYDFCLISPFFATASHPGQRPLSRGRAAHLAALAGKGRAIALGGITEQTAKKTRGLGLAGLAAISLFEKEKNGP